ncbi:helix-turn-helix transcriptional regulator [Lentzea sp. NPDC034063]|uniref:helix-turn-helix domain-containing protein n=1 Tax=unclassified Lentzea TaxID=2643253 RepID=UPI0033ED4131
MPKDFRATALERAVGRELRGWRDERELSLTEAGKRVGFSSAKLSTMENAIQPSTSMDIMALGYVYKVPVDEWQATSARAQLAVALRTGLQAAPAIFDPTEDFPLLFGDAIQLRAFAGEAVPSVFQLAGYSAAVTRNGDPQKAAHVARVHEVWQERSHAKDPLAIEAVVPEAVLRQVIGGPRIMKAQLLRLMEMSERPEVCVRVIPLDAEAYPATGCSFTWLSFPHLQYDDVVYTEMFLRSEYVEGAHKIEQVRDRFDTLQRMTLDEGESMELIAEVAAALR